MRNLIQLIIKHNQFLFFISIEVLALFLIIQNNHFQRSAFINSTNGITASIYQRLTNLNSYFSLKTTNELLLEENAKLLSLNSLEKNNPLIVDYDINYISSKVINNSVALRNNYLTLNKGKLDGVKKEMGVISSNGIVGIIKETSDHFSTVMSVLHGKTKISVKLKKNNHFGSLEWDGFSYRTAKIKDIPNHVNLKINDTVISSGFSSKFPENIPIGIISKIKTSPNDKFHKANILFFENFKELNHVMICRSSLMEEKKELELSNNE